MHADFGALLGVYLIVALILAAVMILVQWRILSKAGYPGALALVSLSLFIPLLNFIGALVVLGGWVWFAFSEWPVEKQAKAAAGAPPS